MLELSDPPIASPPPPPESGWFEEVKLTSGAKCQTRSTPVSWEPILLGIIFVNVALVRSFMQSEDTHDAMYSYFLRDSCGAGLGGGGYRDLPRLANMCGVEG